MNSPSPVQASTRGPGYWSVDGLPELLAGLLWLLWGAAQLIGAALPKNWIFAVYWITIAIGLSCSGLAANRLLEWLRARLTWPRAGYAVPRPDPRLLTLLTVLAAAALLALLQALVAAQPHPTLESLVPPLFGAALVVILASVAALYRAPSYLLLSLIAALATYTLVWRQPTFASMSRLMLAVGLAATLTGAVRFTLFLHNTPLEAQQ